jgi:hypothetical protein
VAETNPESGNESTCNVPTRPLTVAGRVGERDLEPNSEGVSDGEKSRSDMEVRFWRCNDLTAAEGGAERSFARGMVGLLSPGTRLPISSPFFFELAASNGGAPIPKLPRGIGVPPRCSNLAILSRRLTREGLP